MAKRSCDRASRTNESIPSPRHQAKTPATEQSIRFPCCTSLVSCTSLVRESWTGLYNGRCNPSLHNMIEVAKTDVWSNWTTLSARFVRRALQDCERIRAVIRRKFTPADIGPSSMDAIAVEVAWPGRELPHLAKLIVRTVQFGPAEPFFPSLCCID